MCRSRKLRGWPSEEIQEATRANTEIVILVKEYIDTKSKRDTLQKGLSGQSDLPPFLSYCVASGYSEG